ncbi:hypothetical protein LCGC14_2822060, partial [marine sediment metagenome]
QTEDDIIEFVTEVLGDGEPAIDLTHYQTEDGIIEFVTEVLGVEDIAPYQERILRALVRHRKVSVRGLHGLGKTAIAAWFVLWGMSCFHGDTKVATTASNWTQLTHFLWPEIIKWASQAKWGLLGIEMRRNKEILTQSIKRGNSEAFAMTSKNADAIEGAHAANMFYILDEAKTIPKDIFDAAEGALSTAGSDTEHNAFVFAISTPGTASGRFYEIHKRAPGLEDWHVIHVSKEEAVAAGRVSQEWVNYRKRQWGEKSGIYKMKVEGEFDTSGETSVIPLEWIEAAQERWRLCNGKGEGRRSIGVDPARYGTDNTAFADKVGDVVEQLIYTSKEDLMQTTGRAVRLVGGDKSTPIAVDVIGIGAGVVDRLAEMEYAVTGINVAERSEATDISGLTGFKNTRSELW